MEITRAQSGLQELGAHQIPAIKNADLTSMSDFIAAYAQVEPLEKEYDSGRAWPPESRFFTKTIRTTIARWRIFPCSTRCILWRSISKPTAYTPEQEEGGKPFARMVVYEAVTNR